MSEQRKHKALRSPLVTNAAPVNGPHHAAAFCQHHLSSWYVMGTNIILGSGNKFSRGGGGEKDLQDSKGKWESTEH